MHVQYQCAVNLIYCVSVMLLWILHSRIHQRHWMKLQMCLALHKDWLPVCLCLSFFLFSTLRFLSLLSHTTASERFLDFHWLRQRPAQLLLAKTPYQELTARKQDGRTVSSVPGILHDGITPGLLKVVGRPSVHSQLRALCVMNAKNWGLACSGWTVTAGSVLLCFAFFVSALETLAKATDLERYT